MIVKIQLNLDVGEYENDTIEDAIEAAKNQLRSMDFEEILDIADYSTQN